MPKFLLRRDKWRDIIFCSVAVFVAIADQITKALIRANILPGEVLYDFGFFRIDHVQNTGASFGLFEGHSLVIVIVTIIGILVILFLVFFFRQRWSFLQSNWVIVAMALITGGAIGNNLIDRLRQGYVTDFLDFKVWPAFNVSDMCLTVGVILLAYRLIFYSGLTKK